MAQAPLHLAVALDGAGWHPAAWRDPGARPEEVFTSGYWIDLAVEAERGGLDFVTIEDAFDLQDDPGGRRDRVRGRLDAVLLAARIAPHTRDIGLVPTATVTHTEPFHVAAAIATLDYVSVGRAGWRPRISGRKGEAAHFGPWELPAPVEWTRHLEDLFAEATDAVEVVRRLWDSWEDDAVIRDVTTGRFIDRDKLHYADFTGRWFSVKGPSITPRPPQGQPLVAVLAHSTLAYQFAAAGADVVHVTPRDEEEARSIVTAVRDAEGTVGRGGEPLRILADLVVFLDDAQDTGAGRKARLDGLDGAEFACDATVFAGSPERLADLLLAWWRAGLDGFRLRPGTLPRDLRAITRGLVPVLRERDAFRRRYDADTLRGLLGLPRPTNRYAA